MHYNASSTQWTHGGITETRYVNFKIIVDTYQNACFSSKNKGRGVAVRNITFFILIGEKRILQSAGFKHVILLH